MTMAKQPVLPSGRTMVELNATVQQPALKWDVWLTQGNSPEIFLGSVVTYLPIEDWATLNGFSVLHIYGGTRRAMPWERTSIL